MAGKDSPHGRAIYAADTNNLQPRIGAAWDPGGAGRLVVRAGYGMYFDQTQVGMFAQNVQESFLRPISHRTVRQQRAALESRRRHGASRPSAVFTPDALATSDPFVAPRWQHWNVGVQRRLYSRGMIDVGYVGSRGDHLVRYVDINQPQPANLVGHGQAAKHCATRSWATALSSCERRRPRAATHGLLASFRHEAGRAGSATVNYTFSRNKADATFDNSEIDDPQNPLDKDAEFAAAGTDRTHIFNASYVYELPFARGPTARLAKEPLGGWQIAGITRIESGPAARIRVGNCNYEGCVFPRIRCGPIKWVTRRLATRAGLLWFNPAAFVPSPAGEYGTRPLRPFRLPGRHQWDIAVSKT